MQGDDPDHEQAQRWLNALRDGTDTEKIGARRGLARLFERRGMREEAIELLEANVRDGVRNGEIFRWLAQLYREQGDELRCFEALAEAGKYPQWVATADMPSPRDRSTGGAPLWTCRTLVFALGALIGLGILLGVAVWWVASLLRP